MAVALESVVKQLTDSGIIAQGQLENFVPPKAQPKDGEELLRELLKQNLLTKFQATQVAAGKAKALFLGGYTILDKIGAGGMGQVFKAQHRKMERLVAIKMLPPTMTKDATALARFQREVVAAAKLRHPNIVAADDAAEANGVHFLVMEYVEGKDLSAIVKKDGPLPVAKAANYILQAARGLEFAHSEGVIHRDIKPANLLLDKKGVVKILDMGLARIESPGAAQAELTGSGMVMGTVDYMSPEQAFNTKFADAKADIYSLGCTLYFLIAGKATYDGETVIEKLLAHREKEIPSLKAANSNVSDQLEAIFKKMLAKNLEDRYQTMTEVIADLERHGGNSGAVSDPYAATAALSSGALAALKGIEVSRTTAKTAATKQVGVPKPSGGKQPPWKNLKVLAGAGAVGLAVLLGVILIVRDKDDREVARIDAPNGTKVTLPAGGSVQVHSSDSTTAPKTTAAASSSKLFLHDPAFPKWMAEVQAMPAEKQIEAVSKKLMELNPGFDGKLTGRAGRGAPKIVDGVVTELGFLTAKVNDISPVRALFGLQYLACSGSSLSQGKVSDLSPLTGMKLLTLVCSETQVSDLSPLTGMPLRHLLCHVSRVSDLSPLRTVPLETLLVYSTKVSDLTPLEDCKNLTTLTLGNVSPTSIAKLQAKLPNCKIEWSGTTKAATTPTPAAPSGPTPPLAVAPFDAAQAKAHQQAWAKHLGTEVETTNSVGAKMVLIPPGEFMMGSTDEQIEAALKTAESQGADQATKDRIENTERPRHRVAITKPFLIGATEVTVEQFKRFSATGYQTEAEVAAKTDSKVQTYLNPGYGVTDNMAAPFITWNDAVAYCNWLSTKENTTYRLPTEAEWEYSCRAGTTTQFSFGDDRVMFQKYGWYKDASWQSHPVGAKLPNAFGLFDMHGNMNEWCGDYYDVKWYEKTSPVDPTGPSGELADSPRVLRGGSSYNIVSSCRTAFRHSNTPSRFLNLNGFRCVSEVVTPTTASPIPFKSKLFMHDPTFPQWMKDVQAMPAEEQIKAVSQKLVELNPGFDGKLMGDSLQGSPKIDNGIVYKLSFYSDHVVDISPVKAFTKLNYFCCNGSASGKGSVADLSPLLGMNIAQVNFQFTKVADLSPLRGTKIVSLSCADTSVTSLSPLEGMPLTHFTCARTQITDLSPLKGMPLRQLDCAYTPVADLSALAGMSLRNLTIGVTKVTNLSPLNGLPLENFDCHFTQVSDLSPLRGAKLTKLHIMGTPVTDLSPLEGMSLAELQLTPAKITQGIEAIRKMASLQSISANKLTGGLGDKYAPVEFWKKYDAGEFGKPATVPVKSSSQLFLHDPAFPQWMKDVQAMPAEEQIEAVRKKLMELNPGFQGGLHDFELKEPPLIQDGIVTSLGFLTAQVSDISPVHALSGLKMLECGSGSIRSGKLADLSPLRGLQLSMLACNKTLVADLSPLSEMKLTHLYCAGIPISDLSSVQTLGLQVLYFPKTRVSKLPPLAGSQLHTVICNGTPIADFSPLQDCKRLATLNLRETTVTPASVAALQKALPKCKIEWDDPAKATTPQPAAPGTK